MIRSEFFVALGTIVAVASPLPVPSPFPSGNASLEIYHVRDDTASTAAGGAISPDRLLNLKGVVVRSLTDRDAIASVSAAIDSAGARTRDAATTMLDCRWGLRFRTITDRSVHAVYCDASCTNGVVDGRAVTFANGAELVAYLRAHFA